MAFDFPTAPVTGTIYAPSGGPTYRWDGTVWSQIAQPFQGAFPSDTAPSNPVHGQLWWETDTGLLYVYYTDANSSQWVEVISSSMPDPPADGNEYVRVNGVWRLSKESFDLAGKTAQDFVVPTWGPTQARLTITAFVPSNTMIVMRASIDGVGFPAGATDYSAGGFYSQTGGGTFGQVPNTSSAQWSLTGNADHSAIPVTADAVVSIVKVSGPSFGYRTRGGGFVTAAGTNYQIVYYQGYTPGATWTGATALKALRMFTSSAVALNSGKAVVEWLP